MSGHNFNDLKVKGRGGPNRANTATSTRSDVEPPREVKGLFMLLVHFVHFFLICVLSYVKLFSRNGRRVRGRQKFIDISFCQ
jgi:hypothetical protein